MTALKRIVGLALVVATALADWKIAEFVWNVLTGRVADATLLNILLAILGIPAFIIIAILFIGSVILTLSGDF